MGVVWDQRNAPCKMVLGMVISWQEVTQKSFIMGASTPRSNPLPFYISLLTEKGTLSAYLFILKNGTPFTYLV